MAAPKSVQNPEISYDGDVVVIRIDLTQTQGKSSSGKSEIVASTHGNVLLKDGVKLGLNCYRPL
jgi:hypothetical protein